MVMQDIPNPLYLFVHCDMLDGVLTIHLTPKQLLVLKYTGITNVTPEILDVLAGNGTTTKFGDTGTYALNNTPSKIPAVKTDHTGLVDKFSYYWWIRSMFFQSLQPGVMFCVYD